MIRDREEMQVLKMKIRSCDHESRFYRNKASCLCRFVDWLNLNLCLPRVDVAAESTDQSTQRPAELRVLEVVMQQETCWKIIY